MLNEMLLI